MAWSMYYNAEPVMGDVDLEKMDRVSNDVLEILRSGEPVWYDLHDGIGTHRILITPGVAVSFHEENPPDEHPAAHGLSAGRLDESLKLERPDAGGRSRNQPHPDKSRVPDCGISVFTRHASDVLPFCVMVADCSNSSAALSR
ncbi:hypothetical protein [Homoserinimonas sp. A520]